MRRSLTFHPLHCCPIVHSPSCSSSTPTQASDCLFMWLKSNAICPLSPQLRPLNLWNMLSAIHPETRSAARHPLWCVLSVFSFASPCADLFISPFSHFPTDNSTSISVVVLGKGAKPTGGVLSVWSYSCYNLLWEQLWKVFTADMENIKLWHLCLKLLLFWYPAHLFKKALFW